MIDAQSKTQEDNIQVYSLWSKIQSMAIPSMDQRVLSKPSSQNNHAEGSEMEECLVDLNPAPALGDADSRAICKLACVTYGRLNLLPPAPADREFFRTIQLLMLHGY